jgi:drug/metabolite transporter (DMT)-like permease
MRLPKHLSWHVLTLIAILLLLDTTAQLLFKIGVMQIGEFSIHRAADLPLYGSRLVSNPYIICGVLALCIAFFSWLSLISKVELSFAQPMTSLVFVSTPLSAAWLLHEPLHWSQLIGIFLILLGVFIVSDDSPNQQH